MLCPPPAFQYKFKFPLDPFGCLDRVSNMDFPISPLLSILFPLASKTEETNLEDSPVFDVYLRFPTISDGAFVPPLNFTGVFFNALKVPAVDWPDPLSCCF